MNFDSKANKYLLEYYGEKVIKKKAVEEVIELAIAIITNDRDSIVEESADVLNMFNKLDIDMPFTNKISFYNKPLKMCIDAVNQLLIKKSNRLNFNVYDMVRFLCIKHSIDESLMKKIGEIKLKRAVKRTFEGRELTADDIRRYNEICQNDSTCNPGNNQSRL